MRYCDACGGIAGQRLTVPGPTPDRPVELFYCDDECKQTLEQEHARRDQHREYLQLHLHNEARRR